MPFIKVEAALSTYLSQSKALPRLEKLKFIAQVHAQRQIHTNSSRHNAPSEPALIGSANPGTLLCIRLVKPPTLSGLKLSLQVLM